MTILSLSQIATNAIASTTSNSTQTTKVIVKQNPTKQTTKGNRNQKKAAESDQELNNKNGNTDLNHSINSTGNQIPENQSKVTIKTLKAKEDKKWNFNFGINGMTNLYKTSPATNYEQLSYSLGYSHQFNFANISLSTDYNQDLKYTETSDLGDVITTLAKIVKLSDSQQLGFSGNLILPTSKASRIMNQLQLGAGGGISWSHSSGIGLSLSLTRLVHQFETNINGRVLSKLSSKQSISYGTGFGNFGFSLFFSHINGLTYFDQLKESWEHGQEVSYSINEQTSISMGHYNTGSPYKPNGYDSNYSLFNEQTSSVYIGLATGI